MISVSSPGAASVVLWTPSGVISSAHVSTIATGNPSRASHTTRVTVQSGRAMRGKIASAASMMAKATMPYTAITRNTRRRFSSAKKRL